MWHFWNFVNCWLQIFLKSTGLLKNYNGWITAKLTRQPDRLLTDLFMGTWNYDMWLKGGVMKISIKSPSYVSSMKNGTMEIQESDGNWCEPDPSWSKPFLPTTLSKGNSAPANSWTFCFLNIKLSGLRIRTIFQSLQKVWIIKTAFLWWPWQPFNHQVLFCQLLNKCNHKPSNFKCFPILQSSILWPKTLWADRPIYANFESQISLGLTCHILGRDKQKIRLKLEECLIVHGFDGGFFHLSLNERNVPISLFWIKIIPLLTKKLIQKI